MTTTTKIDALEAEIVALRTRLKEAEDELLQERFADAPPKYAVDDIVLVPRNLFGKNKMWPAKIHRVHLSYSAGFTAIGEAYETRFISYGVYLQAKDGSFTGSSDSFYERQVEPV